MLRPLKPGRAKPDTQQNVGDCTAIDRMCPMPDPAALVPIVVACPQTILLTPR